MDASQQEKLFAGARLRRLRRELDLSQAEFAETLGISASYLTLLERNQRPVTARVLLALAESHDVDVRSFAAESDRQTLSDLGEALGDPVLKGSDLDARDVRELADAHPRAAEAMARLFHAYRDASANAAELAARLADGNVAGTGSLLPLEAVRDALDAAQNHFPQLEEAADALREAARLDELGRTQGLHDHLRRQHGAAVRVYDDTVMGGTLRRFDFHARKLLLSEVLSPAGRDFQTALTAVLLDCADILDASTARAALPDPVAARLYRANLAGYTAAAVLMPYDTFHQSAEAAGHDAETLSHRFAVSYEQAAHRLTTLNRPTRRGVPFFLMRIDPAGNVTKRFGGGVIPFARAGGGCPRWPVHDAFRLPERTLTHWVELPDGTRYVSRTRAVARPLPGGGAALQAVVLGCEAQHAARLGLGDSAPAPIPVGLTCRLCERRDCAQRAYPPLQRTLKVEPHTRPVSPFAFS
ncbi:MAG: helix-turn-helix domain-containing protein [Caulobacterales bacterium]|uniref:helix-turn-helix domain-containing protein n=1 Tax=Glycocaulis sp. TaxID=1969725 RepID=UPI003F9F0C77